MATYTEHLWGSSDGVFPSSVLTKRWSTGSEIVLACNANSEAEGGFTFEHDYSAVGRRLNSLDAIDGDGARANIELLARFQINEAAQDNQFALTGRGSGIVTEESGYVCSVFEQQSQILRIQLVTYDGGIVRNQTFSPDVLLVYVTGDWLYLRLRINGSDIKGKLWRASSDEPSDWQVELTDTFVTGVGWGGISQFSGNGLCECDLLSIGTGGDAAPLPVGSTSDPIRISAGYEAVLSTNPDAPIRISAGYAGVLSTNPDAPIRISAAYLAVLHQPPNPQTALLPSATILLTPSNPLAMVAQNFSVLPSESIVLTPNLPTVFAVSEAEIKVKIGAAWELITAPEVKVSAAWKAVTFIEVKRNGAWEVVFEL